MKQMNISPEIPFTKMVGAGNDFILVDNREGLLSGDVSNLVEVMCSRRVSIGADGVLLVEESHIADFKMRYFNADGGEAEFCGNGARCIALYAYLKGIAGDEMTFESQTGVRRAHVNGQAVTIDMPTPKEMRFHLPLSGESAAASFVRVGVPHVVLFLDEIDTVDVVKRGKAIRMMDQFQPEGTNVNFVQLLGSNELKVRTYERGVEDETYSCGTGVCASAVVAYLVHTIQPPLKVVTKTGVMLTVSFHSQGEQIEGCTLSGEAKVVYRGKITLHEEETYGNLYWA